MHCIISTVVVVFEINYLISHICLSVYVCVFVRQAAGHAFVGHSSHVTSVEFLYDDSRLLSSGGKDSAVFQWQVVDSAAVSAAGF